MAKNPVSRPYNLNKRSTVVFYGVFGSYLLIPNWEKIIRAICKEYFGKFALKLAEMAKNACPTQ